MGVDRIGVYPGTFDPITSGHMEVVRRSLRLVDKLVIGPAINIGKGPLFSLEERVEMHQGRHRGLSPDRSGAHRDRAVRGAADPFRARR